MAERIGHLVIEAKLGEGGMGVVYRARDTKLDRAVAVKVLPEALARDPEAMLRFEREARLLASLNHPNVAAIYGIESDGGKTALVLELVQGRSLATLLRREELPMADALDICWQISAGLEAAHTEGIVHRDLKPSNVMVTADGKVKLLDFGLARREERALDSEEEADEASDAETRAGAILGSPGYMSPEQVMGGAAEPRTDLWGFGCILFECLAGERAYDAASAMDAIHAVLYSDIDLSRLPADTPDEIRALVAGCLSREIEGRPGSARHVRLILEAHIDRASQTAATFDGSTPTAIAPGLPQHNLPEEISTFIGRSAESSRVRDQLRESRLLTLTGAGGCGKSRLALRIARWLLSEHTGGAWLVDVASVTDSTGLLHALCDVLEVKGGDDEPPLDAVARRLRHERVLLILDNADHLLAACVQLVKPLLARCSKLRVLVTSRESLGVTGELVHQVPSLATPPEHGELGIEELQTYESVQLFLDRARLVSPELALNAASAEAVATICRRLDGLPLALEMAATRCRMLSPEQIVERLGDAFRLLRARKTTGRLRQQTLEAMIDWSYDHLRPEEQEHLRKLSVFAGGWDLHAANAVCAGEDSDEFDLLDLHEELVKKSMVLVEERRPGEPRYRLLQTVRQFALERLDAAGMGGELRGRHCRYYLKLARETRSRLYGEERAQILDMLEREHANLHQALDHRLGEPDGGPEALQAATAIALFWWYKSRATTGIAYLTRALEHRASQRRDENRRIGLNYLAHLSTNSKRYAVARKAVEESCDIAAETGDPDVIASSLHYCVQLAIHLNNLVEAEEIYTRNLEILRGLGDRRRIAACLQNLGQVKADLGKHEEARKIYGEALEINRELGHRAWEAYNIHGIACVAHFEGDLEEATRLFEHALELFREIDQPRFVMETLYTLGTIAISRGDFDRAARLQKEALALTRRAEDPQIEAGVLRELAEQAMAEDDLDRARALLDRAVSACAKSDLTQPDRRVLRCLVSIARLAGTIATRAEAEHLRAAASTMAIAVEEYEGKNALQREAIDRLDTGWRKPPSPETDAWRRGLALDTGEAIARARNLLSGSRPPI